MAPLLASILVRCPVRECIRCYACRKHRTAKRHHPAIPNSRRQHVSRSERSCAEAELTRASILTVGDTSLSLGRRQSVLPLQSNHSETFTPPATQRWTLSIDAQIQVAVGDGLPAPTCTLQICLATGACGSKKPISDTWSTVSLVTRMQANEVQTATFVTSCSKPAHVTLRNIVTPERMLPGTVVAGLGTTSTTQTSGTDVPPGTISTIDVLTTSSSASLSTAVDATPLPQDPASTRIRAINSCEYNRPILVSVPENPDYMLITESGVTYDLGLDSGNERLSFTPLDGQALCPTVTRTGPGPAVGSAQCSRDGYSYAASAGDIVSLDCASGPAPVPDLADGVDIRFQTSGSCPSIIRQLGCQASGDSCLLDVYRGTVDSSFQLPRDPLRIRAIGEGWSRAYLQVTAPDRATVSYTQDRGSSVAVDQDLLISGTIIQIECDIPLQPKIFSVNVHNACARQPSIRVDSMFSAQVAPGTTTSILVSSRNKVAQLFWAGFFADRSVCVINPRTNIRRCGDGYATTSELGELASEDSLELECPISTVYAKVVNLCPPENPAIFDYPGSQTWPSFEQEIHLTLIFP